MREIKSKLGGSPGDNVKIFIKVVTPQTFLGLRQSPPPGSVPLSPPHPWPHGDKQHSSAVIDLIGFLLKLLYFVQSSRKKQCTNLNTLRPKNSYTVFKVVPFLGLQNFVAVIVLTRANYTNRLLVPKMALAT